MLTLAIDINIECLQLRLSEVRRQLDEYLAIGMDQAVLEPLGCSNYLY